MSRISKTFNLGPSNREGIELQAQQAGRISATVSWSGGPDRLAVILNGPDRPDQPNPVAYYARVDGSSPTTLIYNLTAQDFARGKNWKISVANFSAMTANQITIVIEFPGSETTLPPVLEAARTSFMQRMKVTMPRLLPSSVRIQLRDVNVVKAKMAEVQTLLKNAGIKDLSKVGTLEFTNNFVVQPGVMQPRNIALHGSAQSRELNVLGTLASSITLAPTPPGVPQNEAVLIGTKVDLGNSRLIISENVTVLRIIAEEISSGPQGAITWFGANLALPVPQSYTEPQRQHKSNFKSYNPTVETPASKFTSPKGDNGSTGANGANGYPGRLAPNVMVVASSFKGSPKIDLRGGLGGKGENGQMGEDGGHGARGLHAACGFLDCKRGAGYGGAGGTGGNGGNGGDGGYGGGAGSLDLFVTQEALVSFFSSTTPIIMGGLGAAGGKGGAGGNRGLGGKPGSPDSPWCSEEPSRQGNNGQPGSTGAIGKGFDSPTDAANFGPDGEIRSQLITADDIHLYLTEPYLLRVDPAKAPPGSEVKAYGANLVQGDLIAFDNIILQDARFLTENQMVFTIPANAIGGFHEVKIKRKDSYTNTYLFEVVPILERLSAASGYPGEQVTITGRAFMPDAKVVFGDRSLVPASVTRTQIVFQIPMPTGDSPWIRENGGPRKIAVYNPYPSDETSNWLDFTILKVYGIRFDPAVDGWKFPNTNTNGDGAAGKGVPSWDTLCRTFGEAEVIASAIFQPLFWPFYFFYLWFGTGRYGICTGMATTSLNRFRSGDHSTANIELNQAIREITIAFGHMLGIDQLKRFNNQVEKGVGSVQETFVSIEDFFKNGTDLNQAPVIMFLPSGTIWDRDRFEKAHTVVPYKIIYENETARFPAKVFIYDNNIPADRNLYIRFFEEGGVVRFNYGEYDVDHAYTIGASSIDFMLLTDVDMPISLLEGGLLLLDTVSSPVQTRIENEQGQMIGYKEGKIRLQLPGALFIPFAPSCYVLPFGQKYSRTIEGQADGKYIYSIASSQGFNLILKDVPTKAGSLDVLSMAADIGCFTFQPQGDGKNFSLVAAQKVGEESRILEIDGVQLDKGEKLLFWMDSNLNGFGISNIAKPRSLTIRFRYHKNQADTQGVLLPLTIATLKVGEYLCFVVKDWKQLSAATVQQTISADKMIVPQKVRVEFPM